jgi:hypothetical protein
MEILMKIDHHIVSIPPYISTSWDHVRSLSVKDHILVIALHDDEVIRIPGLSEQEIENIFKTHAEWLEREQQEDNAAKEMLAGPEFNFGTLVSDDGQTSFSILMSGLPGMSEMEAIPGLGIALQHNPTQATSPNLPREVLGRIGSIGKMMIPDGAEGIPEAEPHCNCYYCQIARAIQNNLIPNSLHHIEAEKVSDEELTFCQWDIRSLGEHLFEVTNRLDTLESYKVCLEPNVGCTCGREGCEHLVAVLKS